MIYQNALETVQHGVAPERGNLCIEDQFHGHVLREVCVRAVRGVSAALLLPLDILECLRQGRVPDRHDWLSWLLSAVTLAGGVAMLEESRHAGSAIQRQNILLALLAVVVAAILNGGLQQRDPAANVQRWSRPGRPQSHIRHWSQKPAPAGAESTRPNPGTPRTAASAPGVCCGDCRLCQNLICARTGAPRKQRRPE